METAAHSESSQSDPTAQGAQEGPQAWLSLVASTQAPPQRVKPVVQEKLQVVPEHTATAFVKRLHAAHKPPQQIPASQDVPLETSPVTTHAASPVLHEIFPLWHALPGGTHAAPSTHGPHAPSTQTSFVPHTVPFEALPTRLQVGEPVEQDTTPIWQMFPPGSHAMPDMQLMQLPSPQT